ncbi:MAG: hypothetical protein IIC89_02405 [Chloroflexi bacterium]|nr:hypothetical protein [Chloroflexota bacterium]
MARRTTPDRWRIVQRLREPGVSRVLFCVAALFCIPLAFAVYWPTLGDYFLRDDFNALLVARDRPLWEVIYRAFVFPEIKAFDEVTLAWRPLTDIYFLGARVFGLNPELYHIVNILLHGLVGASAVIFVWRLTRSAAAGLATGLLFVVAPTYSFAVTWISQGSEMFGALMIVLALFSYHGYLTADRAHRSLVVATALLAALAVMSKESMVIVFALLPLLAAALPQEERRRSLNEVVVGLLPVAVVAMGYGIITLVGLSVKEGGAYEAGPHVWSNLRDYLEWIVYPDASVSAQALRTAGAIGFVLMGVLALLLRQRMLAFFAAWTILALLIYTGFDREIELRYTYLATLPYIAFLVSGAVALLRRLPGQAAVPIGAIAAIAVVLALVVSPSHTRDQQVALSEEGAGYEAMVTGVRTLCGAQPVGGHVFVVYPRYNDQFQFTQLALNLYYDDLNATSVRVLPLAPLIQLIEDKCVIQYQAEVDRYVRLE